MEVQLFDHAVIGKHEPLGKVLVELQQLLDHEEIDLGEMPIPAPHRGVVSLSISFRPVGIPPRRGSNPLITNLPREQPQASAYEI
jgi:hypothetical protein